MDGEFSCALCLDFFSEHDEDYFVTTECGHIFHQNCIKSSFDGGFKECPICRTPVDLEKVRKLFGIHPKRDELTQSPGLKLVFEDESPATEQIEYDYKFKIILVGDSGVGKSSLMQRYCDEQYSEHLFSTVGCDWRTKNLEIGGKKIALSIWDSVGQEKYRSLVTNYVRGADGCLIVYDITDATSITTVEDWLSFVDQNGPECVKILIGNKSDLEMDRTVPKSIGKKMAEKLSLGFFETSAKDDYNVNAAFRFLTAEILDNEQLIKRIEERKLNPNIQLDSRGRNRNAEGPGPLGSFCAFTKHGLSGTWKGIKAGWHYISK